MPRAVRFDNYGGLDVLYVADVQRPAPRKDQLVVKVKAAGINPGEAAIREGAFAKRWPATFPSGQGSDFAGVVEEVGSGVDRFKAGDEVVGFSNDRSSQADFIVVGVEQLTLKPPNLSWEQAGGLFVAGTTAYAAIRAVGIQNEDTVVVSGAAGGVGSIAIQLAKAAGAKAIGIAGEANHDWLRSKGVVPVSYGDGLADRLRAAAGGKAGGQIDAFVDTSGKGYVELALKLDVPPTRIDTIIDFAAAQKYGVKTAGNADGASAGVLAELAAMVASGRLEIPIAKTYPLAEVREAYRELAKGHTHGKIVLMT